MKLDKKVNIIYRNYNNTADLNQLKELKEACKNTRRKLYLANDFKLALKLKIDGVYIPAFNKNLNIKYFNKKRIEVLGSAHNLKEVNLKKKQGINKIFLSPIFKTEKKENYLDIMKFNLLSKYAKGKIIALGGINRINIKKLKLVKCEGFAGIKYFNNEK